MERICRIIAGGEQFKQVKNGLLTGKAQGVVGLSPLPCAVFAGELAGAYQQALLVTAGESAAAEFYENLRALYPDRVLLFPDLELLPVDSFAQNIELRAARLAVISRLLQGERLLVVSSAAALMRRLPPPALFKSKYITLKKGERYDLERLYRDLSNAGYERTGLVEIAGSFSLRGDILDIYPIDGNRPLRFDFFDDELEKIRFFDPESQLTAEETASVLIVPARPEVADEDSLTAMLTALQADLAKTALKLNAQAQRELKLRFASLAENIRQGTAGSGIMEQLACYLYKGCSLIDYLTKGAVMLCEPKDIKKELEDEALARASRYEDLLLAGRVLPSFYNNFIDYEELASAFEHRPLVCFSALPDRGIPCDKQHFLSTRQSADYRANPQMFAEESAYLRSAGRQVFVCASTELRLKQVRQIIGALDFPAVNFVLSAVSGGFECAELNLAVITEKELLGAEKKQRLRRSHSRLQGEKIESFLDLAAGDYVVHISQGIGRYLGVERLKVGENARDYLLIQYAGTDKLYLPVDQLDLIQKYIGSEGKAPKLYKLGGSEWQRVKARVRASVRDMAKELLALYAAREAAEGNAFSPDTPWQREFEDRFIYEETPDQLRAIEEIKADMENSKPMDRLLCGDVGYGKTEVAMRAAFKAVSDGKQVALLAPTTVLAQQHFRTFSERFADYPVSIAVLGRFTSSREQKSIVEKMAKGEIDLLIGTHRILSKDVKFKDLGLLIVDEEQRFGVAHKEKIKTLKTNIDVLVLSATPIPRTLHMALAGMRDMSVIETPPAERRPVQTYVLEYFDRLIKDAVQRELSRGGQVYFVHNKIMSIDRLADDLAELIPQARIAVAHGRMPEGELERVMSEFVEGKHNLLVCTTIIESGLDIPNVNTLIVNEADKFGLAQLYQLRGRVGRSERQAYAYFTYRPNHIINETAKKRLLAIRDFTELGAGFKIAMRDLEIRGAGDILGAQQHGHIAAVGFDLYCRLLREEIERGADESKPVVEEVNTQLDLDINAYIPDSYLADGNLKIEIYKRIAAARSLSELDELRAELLDRYGRIPAALNNLLLLGGLKTYTRALGIAAVSRKGSQIIMRLAQGRELKPESLMGLLAEYPGQICFRQKQDFLIIITVGDLKEREVIDSLMNILSRLSELNAL